MTENPTWLGAKNKTRFLLAEGTVLISTLIVGCLPESRPLKPYITRTPQPTFTPADLYPLVPKPVGTPAAAPATDRELRPEFVPTAEAARIKGRKDTFEYEGTFDPKTFQEIEKNVFSALFQDNSEGIPPFATTAWLIKTNDPEHIFLATSEHKTDQNYRQIILSNNNFFGPNQIVLYAEAVLRDEERDITVFRANRRETKNVQNLGRGLVTADDVNPYDQSLFGIFGYPTEFLPVADEGPILMGLTAVPARVQTTDIPEDYYSQSFILTNTTADSGESGSPVFGVDKKTGQLRVIGVVVGKKPWSEEKPFQNEGNQLIDTIISPLDIQRFLEGFSAAPQPGKNQ